MLQMICCEKIPEQLAGLSFSGTRMILGTSSSHMFNTIVHRDKCGCKPEFSLILTAYMVVMRLNTTILMTLSALVSKCSLLAKKTELIDAGLINKHIEPVLDKFLTGEMWIVSGVSVPWLPLFPAPSDFIIDSQILPSLSTFMDIKTRSLGLGITKKPPSTHEQCPQRVKIPQRTSTTEAAQGTEFARHRGRPAAISLDTNPIQSIHHTNIVPNPQPP